MESRGLLIQFAFIVLILAASGCHKSKSSAPFVATPQEETKVDTIKAEPVNAEEVVESSDEAIAEEEPAASLGEAIRKDMDFGLKSGTQLYKSFLVVTGIEETAALQDAYFQLETSLPAHSHKLADFTAGHVAAILKLASHFCNALVNSPAHSQTFFNGCNYNKVPAQLSVEDKSCIAQSVTNAFWRNTGEKHALSDTEKNQLIVETMDSLIPNITAPSEPTSSRRLVKAACVQAATSLPALLL